MNRYLTPFLFLLSVTPVLGQFRFTPDRPKIDGSVSFTYTPTGPLVGETDIQAVFLRYGSPTQMRLSQSETAPAAQVGAAFVGTIKIPFKEVAGLLVAFQSRNNPALIDHNNAHFYPILLYSKTGTVLPHAIGGQASVLMRTSFPYLLKVKPDWAWAVGQYEQEIAQHPATRSLYWADLVRAKLREGQQGQTRPDYRQTCLADIDAYLTSEAANLTPADLRAAAELYTQLNEPQLAQKARDRISSVDHSTDAAQKARVAQIAAETDLGKKRANFNDFVATLPRSPYRGVAVSSVAEAYFKADKLRELVEFMGAEAAPETDPVLMLSFAHQLAKEGRGMPQADWLANRAIWAFGKRPVPANNKQLAMERAGQIRAAQAVSAHALYEQNRYLPALNRYRDIWAATPPRQTDPTTNERIWLCAQKTSQTDSVLPFMLTVVRANRTTASLRNSLRDWQTARLGGTRELATYQSNLAVIEEADRRAVVMEKFTDEPAPPFTLVALNGRRVSLASLRGKVVVLDFWATWCEPCRASLSPKLQVRNGFRNVPGVQFLYVNTHETATKGGVRAFAAKQIGGSPVPLDPDRKMADAYGVKLLPSTILIDAQGRIRYRSTGYSDNAQATADELRQAIEVLNEGYR
ncbi:TlpA family protein disulfide reductase [Fibrella sp. WM1]|uniref:TlpA family protein disulfide reductase n=1 Tax=Fibrella musci TaxID=3242485 RepID=UPI0035211E01